MDKKPAGLMAALLEAQKSIDSVDKDSHNSFAKYNYASTESILAEARVVLHNQGILVYRKDGPHVDGASMKITFTAHHVASGESLDTPMTFPCYESKGKPPDKAVLTSMTICLGYYLRDLLALPRVEAGTDVDQRDDTSHQPPSAVYKSIKENLKSITEATRLKSALLHIDKKLKDGDLSDTEYAELKRIITAKMTTENGHAATAH